MYLEGDGITALMSEVKRRLMRQTKRAEVTFKKKCDKTIEKKMEGGWSIRLYDGA